MNYKAGIIILIGTGGQGQNPVLTGQFHVLVEYGLAFILLKNSKYSSSEAKTVWIYGKPAWVTYAEKTSHSISS